MIPKEPSRTAQRAASHRAVHQVRENGIVFTDPFARQILSDEVFAAADAEAESQPSVRGMRFHIALRSRIAEDALADAVSRGARQLVVLGAGYDTFALRNPYAAQGLRVFEVDHPATQAWKRERLSVMKADPPGELIFVPVDFEREKVADELAVAGFDAEKPAFFIWLGVVPYLTREAVESTLRFVASVPQGEVVFDYSEPIENYEPARRAFIAEVARRVAAIGEPFLSHFDPSDIAALLRGLGFSEIDDKGLNEMTTRYIPGPAVLREGAGPHVMRARRA